MDIMDEMRGYFIVMLQSICLRSLYPVIIRRGYTPVYLPPYSPELNPIEQFWAVVKAKVKRSKLTDSETPVSRIIEAAEFVPVGHLKGFIQHSINQFQHCLNKVL